ncbi:MAG: UDP-N-acetylmuramoyl-tripeptide--D-alanyl-D-alanine ligase [Clostridiales bacterium]|nr:UDP-N-acetylmuramoyl-tripeptide--D-alanyl-D-alanine ligase [Clostridiales bacterium]
MTVILYILSASIFAWAVYLLSIRQLHMAQLEGYKPTQYLRWITNNICSLFLKELIVLAVAGLFLALYYVTKNEVLLGYSAFIVWAFVNVYMIYKNMSVKRKAKKPLRFTPRAIRLFITNLLLLLLWTGAACFLAKNIIFFILYLSLIKFLHPLNMALSTFLIYPFEMLVHYRYYRIAQLKIAGMKNLKVIGITGSYGKTSTKYFLKTILSEKYNTLMTPESYNTPMGITRVIREQLKDNHEVFVCEMGARNVGDIKTLCKLVNPTVGILTSIGPQHLETFKSLANIVKTKYELIQALPYYGTAIFNGDNSYCLNLARKTGIETLIYSIKGGDSDIFLTAEGIKISKEGLRFKVKSQDGIEFECQTRLLGKHNVSNLLAAICAALKLGLTPDEIKRGISKIEPVPHRLEILKTNNGVTVIDDAFNSNPVGSREALEAIKEFTDGSRIVVTPGMVELGSIEYEENKKFGKVMSKCCDLAILVGIKRSKPIIEGLKMGNFPEDKIIVVPDLNEAQKKIGQIVKVNDVVLFENDLPDNYNEK